MNNDLSRRTLLQILAGAVGAAGLSMTGCATGTKILPNPGENSVSQLQIRNPANFKILQITDLHFFSGKRRPEGKPNDVTIGIMEALVDLAKPDLLLVTGDLWPDSRGEAAYNLMHFAIEQIENLDVPWAFTWGNHDELPDYAIGHEAFATAENSLYAGEKTGGNYVVNIVDRHKRCLWQFLCLNSEKDGLGVKQQQWLRSLQSTVPHSPRWAVFHIPVKQYDDIWRNGAASGIMGETPCIEKEDGSTLPLLKSLGVTACLCGHDHRNDYSGVYDGVDLIYGRATGVGGYGADLLPKGGKLYTLNCKTGAYDWVTLLPDGTRWHPKPGERKLELEKK